MSTHHHETYMGLAEPQRTRPVLFITYPLILIEVNHDPSESGQLPDRIREAMVTPKRASRHEMLAWINHARSCADHREQRCLVYHNEILWPEQEGGTRLIGNGDYASRSHQRKPTKECEAPSESQS